MKKVVKNEVAAGHYRLREGFVVHWYRSSQKRKRDAKDRKARIRRTIDRLENLNLNRMRGPKTEAVVRKRIEYLALMIASLIERELRNQMQIQKIELLASLPEARKSKTPTFEHVHRLFQDRTRQELYGESKMIKSFSEPLTRAQRQALSLLGVAEDTYIK